MENKISEILKYAKLNFEIIEQELNLDKLYRELGKLVYFGKKGNEECDKFIDDMCEIISYKINKIEKLENNKNLRKNSSNVEKKVKPKMKEKTKKVQEFVRPEQAPEPVVEENGFSLYKFCPKCQIGNNPSAEKCVYCGEKF